MSHCAASKQWTGCCVAEELNVRLLYDAHQMRQRVASMSSGMGAAFLRDSGRGVVSPLWAQHWVLRQEH